MSKIRQDILIALCFALSWFVFGFATIDRYGVMNDAPIKYASGFRNYYFLKTGDKAYLDPMNTPALAEKLGLLKEHGFLSSTQYHPVDYSPLVDALSFLTCEIFHQKLHWLNFFDAHNSIVVILFSVFVGVVYLFTQSMYGRVAGILSGLLFAFFPKLVAEAHNNLSDIPLMFFFFATSAVFYHAVTRASQAWLIASIALFGLAVAAKLNSVFLIFILLPWMFVHKYLNHQNFSLAEKRIWAFSPLIAYFSWVAIFPYFWTADSLADFFPRQIHSHIFTMIFHEKIIGQASGWNWSIFLQAFATTPTLCILFFVPGFVVSLRDFVVKKDSRFVLLLLWLLVPMAKSALPGIKNYEMIRHFMEYIPALVIFSAIGAQAIFRLALRIPWISLRSKLIGAGGGTALLIALAYPVYTIHPYEILYFNSLIGGLGGAQKHFMYAFDYWQTSLRASIDWLNKNARENTAVTTVGYYDYNVMEPAILRKDLKKVPLQNTSRPVTFATPENTVVQGIMNVYDYSGYILLLSNNLDRNEFRFLLNADNTLKPVHTIQVDGVVVARTYYWDRIVGIIDQPDRTYFVYFGRDGKVERTVVAQKVSIPRGN